MGTPITDAADGGGGGGGQLPVAPLPDGLKDAPEETQQRYFKEAKRVAIEKCRTHRCGNDEVSAKTHLGPEIFITEEDAALLGRTEWKRPSLTACTAQEFAYDFFKFHENRGEFDYESLWECVLFSLARGGLRFAFGGGFVTHVFIARLFRGGRRRMVVLCGHHDRRVYT